jgi:hypothetical protein
VVLEQRHLLLEHQHIMRAVVAVTVLGLAVVTTLLAVLAVVEMVLSQEALHNVHQEHLTQVAVVVVQMEMLMVALAVLA